MDHLPITFAHDDVDAADDCGDVGEQAVTGKVGGYRKVAKTGASGFEAIGYGSATTFNIEAQLSASAFGFEINFTGRDFEISWQCHAMSTGGEAIKTLANDVNALAHLLDADVVAIPAITEIPHAAVAHGDIELEIIVNEIGLDAAEVPGDSAAAEHGTGDAVVQSHFFGQHADARGTFDEDVIEAEEVVVLGDFGFKVVEEFTAFVDPLRGEIVGEAADGGVAVSEAGAASCFKEIEDKFALAERVKEGCEGTQIETIGAHADEVRRNAVEFAHDHANELGAAGDF